MSVDFNHFDTWLKFSLLRVEYAPAPEGVSASLLPLHKQHRLCARMPKGFASEVRAAGRDQNEAVQGLKELLRHRDLYLQHRQKTITLTPWGTAKPFVELSKAPAPEFEF